jgi:Protein of unknown function (DUF2997)
MSVAGIPGQGSGKGRQILVRVAADGTVTATTRGIPGQDCLECIPLLEDVLESAVVSSSYTADFWGENDDAPLPGEESS